jgi:hypothetical protein
MTKIRFILSNGQETDWREVDVTSVIVISLGDYDETHEITDINIENEGESIEPQPTQQKESNIRYVYEREGTAPYARKKPWEFT